MFNDFKNKIDFFIRNKTKFSRKNFVENNPDIIERIRNENSYIYDLLKRYFVKNNKNELKILDIGSKNWYYAKAEYDYFNSFCNNVYLDGVELDAYRLYTNLYSRYEVAKYYIKNLSNTRYLPQNLLDINEKYDYITWFLPFVIKEPLLYWGLPEKYFLPKELLAHAYSLLNSQGQMLIINQGEIEAIEQEKLLKELLIPYKNIGEISSHKFKYKNKRYGYIITKYD